MIKKPGIFFVIVLLTSCNLLSSQAHIEDESPTEELISTMEPTSTIEPSSTIEQTSTVTITSSPSPTKTLDLTIPIDNLLLPLEIIKENSIYWLNREVWCEEFDVTLWERQEGINPDIFRIVEAPHGQSENYWAGSLNNCNSMNCYTDMLLYIGIQRWLNTEESKDAVKKYQDLLFEYNEISPPLIINKSPGIAENSKLLKNLNPHFGKVDGGTPLTYSLISNKNNISIIIYVVIPFMYDEGLSFTDFIGLLLIEQIMLLEAAGY